MRYQRYCTQHLSDLIKLVFFSFSRTLGDAKVAMETGASSAETAVPGIDAVGLIAVAPGSEKERRPRAETGDLRSMSKLHMKDLET